MLEIGTLEEEKRRLKETMLSYPISYFPILSSRPKIPMSVDSKQELRFVTLIPTWLDGKGAEEIHLLCLSKKNSPARTTKTRMQRLSGVPPVGDWSVGRGKKDEAVDTFSFNWE